MSIFLVELFFSTIDKYSFFEYIPFGVAGRAKAKIEYSWVDNPVFIKDKTTAEYLDFLVKGKDCYCYDGKILMRVTTTIL